MTGRIFLTCVLLLVLAIPLIADQTLVNPVGEFSTISTITSKGELVNQIVSASVYEIVAVKPDEIVIPLPEGVEITYGGMDKSNGSDRTEYIKYGGGRRIKSGRH